MDHLLDAIFDSVLGGGRLPRVDPVVAVIALVVGLGTGFFMYGSVFEGGGLGLLAWVLIPMAATVIGATLFSRPHAIRGALLSAGVALVIGLPMAILDLMFSFWA